MADPAARLGLQAASFFLCRPLAPLPADCLRRFARSASIGPRRGVAPEAAAPSSLCMTPGSPRMGVSGSGGGMGSVMMLAAVLATSRVRCGHVPAGLISVRGRGCAHSQQGCASVDWPRPFAGPAAHLRQMRWRPATWSADRQPPYDLTRSRHPAASALRCRGRSSP